MNYQKTNQAVFGFRFIKQMKLGEEGVKMPNLDFKRMVSLFILCTKLFLNSYYNVNPCHLSFVDNMENFKNYDWWINVCEEILEEVDLCNGSLTATGRQRERILNLEERGSPKLLNM